MEPLDPRPSARWTAALAAASAAVSLVVAGPPAAADSHDDVILPAETFAGGTDGSGVRGPTANAKKQSGHVTAETGKESDTVTRGFKIGKGPNVGLKLTADGDPVAGGTGTFEIEVANAEDAGATTGRVTVDYDVPRGSRVTEATGDGWDCRAERWNVTCSREDALTPGAAYPPIRLTSRICAKHRCRELRPTVTVTADGDTDPFDNVLVGQAVPVRRESALTATVTEQNGGFTVHVLNEGPSDEPGGLLKLSGVRGLTWKCEAPRGSACPADLNAESADGVPLYVAGGATVTLQGGGHVPEGATLTAEVTALPALIPAATP